MLRIEQVTRTFGPTVALDAVSFDVPDGHLVGFVGGNGAGKTTAMRIIMGLLQPDAGTVHWQGRQITQRDRRRFGYMPEERGLYPKQPVLDQLVYLARLHGQSVPAARAQAGGLLERFGLADRLKDKLEKLSLGNQQRVQIVAAVMSTPECLILDEPFSGLDVDAVDEMVGLLREFTGRGVPVLFSSHQLDLVERICDRLVILSRGRLVAAGSQDELRSRGVVRYRLVMDVDAGWVRQAPGVQVDELTGGTALLQFTEPDAQRRLLTAALERGNVLELARLRPSVSDIYREVTA